MICFLIKKFINMMLDVKLQIGFPKSSEDHRLQLIEINHSIFAIVHGPLESLGPIALHCEEWSLVLLSPIKSKTNILISAINVICLNEIASEEGVVNIHASNRLVKLTSLITAPGTICEMGERREFQLDDNPGTLLHYYRLFDGIISHVRSANPDDLAEAKQKVIMGLCTLADKMSEKTDHLNLRDVLKIWGISDKEPQNLSQ
jgi:hypothetical protein